MFFGGRIGQHKRSGVEYPKDECGLMVFYSSFQMPLMPLTWLRK
jgi:hypothetical protein